MRGDGEADMIPFNKPYLAGSEAEYILDAVRSGKISGNGAYTQKCHTFFANRYRFAKCLLTTSCTDALEMAAILSDIKPGDEVIVPSFTFVTTALAFVRQGAEIVFADSRSDHPNIDEDKIELLITDKTRVIVPVHYAGVACNMGKIRSIAAKHRLIVVEDAAQSIDSYYDGVPLGSLGNIGCFSFHETKNIISGEGGMIVVNDAGLQKRADYVWEKGTNRVDFFRGEINKYGWVDLGSSFLPSEIIAAFLYAQLENMDAIQSRRLLLWNAYYDHLSPHQGPHTFQISPIPEYATNNAHMFFIICSSSTKRDAVIQALKDKGILAVTHYQSLHRSDFYLRRHSVPTGLENADLFTERLLRLPLYYELEESDVRDICDIILKACIK
jgi:dTDP-4-amino-4,6-dideoxygalactose transaminase